MNISTKELSFLSNKDSKLAKLIIKYGNLSYKSDGNVFAHIVDHIIGQMLSKQAADTIIKRVRLTVDYTPDAILKINKEKLRKCGVSYGKISYIKGFAKAVKTKKIDLESLKTLPSEEVIKELTKIKGIGVWTAEMIALFTLGHKNIFSFGDVALKNGIMAAKGYKSISKTRFESLRKLYSPYCSIASMYFYRYNNELIGYKKN